MAEMPSHAVTIDVTGIGRVSIAPTLAELYVTCRGRGKKATTAVKASATTARKVVKALGDHAATAGAHGIGHASVHEQTRWDGDREVAEGWEAQHQLTVTVDDVKKAFEVMAEVAAIDHVSIAGPSWLVDAGHPVHDEARRLAVDDARAKAASYASAAGLLLGRLLTISDGAGAVPSPMLERSASVGSLSPAAVDMVASVQLVFEASGGTP